jgi:L-seryl-tRNA(Ser) seleniumtransferase
MMKKEGLEEALRQLPAVDRLAREVSTAEGVGEREATSVARAVLAGRRAELLAGDSGRADLLERARLRRRGLRRVLNATGVIIHTNLGRAPLASGVADAAAEAGRGYIDLELDLASGRRGARGATSSDLLSELTGAEDALVVNNGAAAVLLAVAALAGSDRDVVVSRGQLVEIGGGFRVPEIIIQGGSRLVEVGTTNRTRLEDYVRAVDSAQEPPVILRVHPSNFRVLGFVEEVEIEPLCALGVSVIHDVGSGLLVDDPVLLGEEPGVRRSVAAGAALTCFSGDKLLGGPQAGLLVGAHEAVEACRRHPLARALRAGRLTLAALEATLRLYRDPDRALREVPVLAMLRLDSNQLEARAERLAEATGGEVVASVSRVGGGALPLTELRGPAVVLPDSAGGADALAHELRTGEPPVVARITDGRVLLDPRGVAEEDLEALAAAATAAAARLG